MLNFDQKRWPRAASYAAGLVDGLKSFGACEVHTDTFDHLRKTHPELVDIEGLPDGMRRVLKGELPTPWVPEVVGNLIHLTVRDQLFASDEAYYAWALEAANVTFSKPWTRALMYVLAPTLIIMGVGKRWQSFHHGSTLSAEKAVREGERMRAQGKLEFPAGLFNELLLKRIGVSFEAALQAAKAGNPSTAVSEITETSAVFRMTWDA